MQNKNEKKSTREKQEDNRFPTQAEIAHSRNLIYQSDARWQEHNIKLGKSF